LNIVFCIKLLKVLIILFINAVKIKISYNEI